jgi:hypothetical protein
MAFFANHQGGPGEGYTGGNCRSRYWYKSANAEVYTSHMTGLFAEN